MITRDFRNGKNDSSTVHRLGRPGADENAVDSKDGSPSLVSRFLELLGAKIQRPRGLEYDWSLMFSDMITDMISDMFNV